MNGHTARLLRKASRAFPPEKRRIAYQNAKVTLKQLSAKQRRIALKGGVMIHIRLRDVFSMPAEEIMPFAIIFGACALAGLAALALLKYLGWWPF